MAFARPEPGSGIHGQAGWPLRRCGTLPRPGLTRGQIGNAACFVREIEHEEQLAPIGLAQGHFDICGLVGQQRRYTGPFEFARDERVDEGRSEIGAGIDDAALANRAAGDRCLAFQEASVPSLTLSSSYM